MASTAMRRRSPHALRALFTISVAAFALALSPAPACADETPAEVEQEISDAWNRLEPVIEQYNLVQQQLTADQALAKQLEDLIRPLRLQVDVARQRVSSISVRMYMTGSVSPLNALLSSGSPATFADQISMLNQVARRNESMIAAAARLEAEYVAQKRPLDELIARESAQAAELAAKKQLISAEIDKLQALRRQAYANTGGLGSLRPAPCPYTLDNSRGSKAAQFACQQIGKPYVWAADGPGSYDCSGLTMAAWRSVGVSLPHNAAAQHGVVPAVSLGALRNGDLIFYYSDIRHVGIYVGGGWVVHAPSPGDVVRMAPYDRAPIHSAGRPG